MLKLGQFAMVLIVAVGLFAVIVLGVNVHEKQECEKWRIEAREGYEGYYFTEWMVEQCEAQGVPLPATVPVLGYEAQ